MDWIVTGASRGIGRALVRALATNASPDDRIFAVARDAAQLTALAIEESERCAIVAVPVDLTRTGRVREVGEQLAERLRPGATLIHNAGIWPSKRVLVDGVEAAFATNCLGPLALQAPLLAAGRLRRVLAVSAGLLVKGRFDPSATPTGADFSAFRTYCNTKLAGAVAMRAVARRNPSVEFAVVHPGVANTDLGARNGLLGWVLKRVKRTWEAPEFCAARLARLLGQPRWERTPGDATWYFEEAPQPWPDVIDSYRDAVLAAVEHFLRSDAPRRPT